MTSSRATLTGLLFVLLLPTALLGPSLARVRTFVPFDVARFPPISTTLQDDELAAVVRDSNTDPSEVVTTFVPELRFARQELEAGRLPQWNPYARFGAPLQATGVVGLDYPPNWIALAHADPQDGLAWCAWLSLVIAGSLMFGFLRSIGLTVGAAVLGAIAFSISGTVVAQAHFYQRLASLVWLPGMLWAIRATSLRRGLARGWPVAGLAAAVGMTWLAGFAPNGAPVLLAASIYALVRLVAEARADGPGPALRTALWLGAGVALGTALASVQLLPMAAFYPESSRGETPTADVLASLGLAPAGLIGWLAPTLFGNPFDSAVLPYDRSPLAYWLLPRFSWADGHPFPPRWNFTECTIFAGTLTLGLAVFSVLRPRRTTERGLLAALVTLVLLSGGYWWLGWLHDLPGVRSVFPVRFAGPTCALIAALAAIGLDRIRAEPGADRRRGLAWFCSVGAALALASALALGRLGADEFVAGVAQATVDRFGGVVEGLRTEDLVEHLGGPGLVTARAARDAAIMNAWRASIALALAAAWLALSVRAGSRAHLVAIVLVGAELAWFAAPLLEGRRLTVPHDSPVHAFLREERDRLAPDGGYTVARGTARGQGVLPLALPPCQLVPERVRDLVGYTFVDRSSHRPIERIWGPEQMFNANAWPFALPDDARLAHPYLDLIGVRWVLSEDELAHAGRPVGPRLVGPRMRPDGEAEQFWIYERPDALPRAFVVPKLEVVEDEDAVLDALTDVELAPRSAAWVAAVDAPLDLGARGERAAAEREVAFVRDDVQELELRIADGPAGWLVLNDAWFAGWSATVGGDSASLVRANLSMRAVRVPAGEVVVVFRYEPPGFVVGLIVSALATAVVVLLAGFAWMVATRARSN